jgi:hypothetical protein
MHKLQTRLKYSLSLLLQVAARLFYPRGVHALNLKLTDIKQMTSVMLNTHSIHQPNSAKRAERIISKQLCPTGKNVLQV